METEMTIRCETPSDFMALRHELKAIGVRAAGHFARLEIQIAWPASATYCQCCGAIMDEQSQTWIHKPATVIVTCRTKGCTYFGYTLVKDGYQSRDLSYLVKGR